MKFSCILADPPWTYNNRHVTRKDNPTKKTKFGIGVAERYKGGVLSFEDIYSIPVSEIADEDCFLFLWTVPPSLPDCLKTFESWGFRYVTKAFCWVKTYPNGRPFFGPGHYTAANSEDCYLGVRGNPDVNSLAAAQILDAPEDFITTHPRYDKQLHSHKPTPIRDRIVQLCGDVPRIELFARTCGPGWHATGLEYNNEDIFDSIKRLSQEPEPTSSGLRIVGRR